MAVAIVGRRGPPAWWGRSVAAAFVIVTCFFTADRPAAAAGEPGA